MGMRGTPVVGDCALVAVSIPDPMVPL